MTYILLQFFGVNTLTALHWFLAIAITLLIIDSFTNTVLPSTLAILLFADYCNTLFCHFIPIQWYYASYFVFLAISYALYYFIWKSVVMKFAQKTFMRNAVNENFQPTEGETGKFRVIEGEEFVYWNGELWQISSPTEKHFNDGDKVVIVKNTNGKLTIK